MWPPCWRTTHTWVCTPTLRRGRSPCLPCWRTTHPRAILPTTVGANTRYALFVYHPSYRYPTHAHGRRSPCLRCWPPPIPPPLHQIPVGSNPTLLHFDA